MLFGRNGVFGIPALAAVALLLVGFEGGSCATDGTPAVAAADRQGQSTCEDVLCELHCEYGFQRGEDGCPICACNPPPTGDCPEVMCMLHCEHGFQTNDEGCPICACNPPPGNGCGEFRCQLHCDHGYVVGPDGCPLCECAEVERPCDSMLDCGDEQACIGGHCVGGEMCAADDDCPGNERCVGGFCTVERYECFSDADCPGGHCAHFVACQAIGCPPSYSACVY